MTHQNRILIKNGTIIDGTGGTPFPGDILIQDDRIKAIIPSTLPASGSSAASDSSASSVSEASSISFTDKVIDASGKAVAPGMIDSHSHADLNLLKEPLQEFDLCQGVTTEVVGLCGLGFVPLKGQKLDENMKYSAGLFGYDKELINDTFSSFDNYMKAIDGSGINVAVSATHNAARIAANGFQKKISDLSQYHKKMEQILEAAMESGCIGLSTGLSYYPCAYADFDELVFLAKALKKYDGTFLTHIRYPVQGLPDSALDEIIRVGEQSHARIHILHYRTKYPYDYGHPERLLQKFEEANKNGCDFTLETLPYLSGSTFIHAILPGWTVDGGFDATIRNLKDPALRPRIVEEMQYLLGITAMGNGKPPRFGHVGNHAEYSGQFIRDVCAMRGQNLNDMLLDLLIESDLDMNYVGNEAEEDPKISRILMNDTMTLLMDPLYLCGSDSMPYGEYPHPRTYGCYAKMLRLSRERSIPLEKMIQKLTSCVADRLQLSDVGRLENGKRADIMIFDPSKITDASTFKNPKQTAKGMDYVIVGGKISVKDGKPTGIMNGTVIKKIR